MRTSHKHTRILFGLTICLALIGVSLIPGKTAQAIRSAFSRMTDKSPSEISKAAPVAIAQDKNAAQGKPEPPPEVSVLQVSGPVGPKPNNAIRLATVASRLTETEPNGTPATATAIGVPSGRIIGNIFPNGDIDFYSFTANAGDRFYAATMTSGSAGNSTDSQITLIASDGTTTIEFDDDNGSFAALSSSIAGATIPTTGVYYLKVNDFTAGTTSERPYELWFQIQSGTPTPEVEANDTPATANPLPANGWVSGTRNPAAATEQDWYSFNLNAGDTVFLSLDVNPERDGTVWNGRLGFALFGDAGNQILVVDDAGTGDVTPVPNNPSEAFFMTVKNAGTYFAFVDSASAAVGGPTATYNLSVSVLPAKTGVNCTTYTSTDVPKTIGPGTGLVSSVITVPGNPRIEDIDVDIVLNHALMQDIDAHLRSPAGNNNGLFADIGAAATGGQQQMDVTFDDEAGIPPAFTALKGTQLKPENNSTAGTASTSGAFRLASFYGENGGGTWTLDLRDDTAGANGGTLTAWSIKICEEPPLASCPAGFTRTTVFSTDFESGAAGFTHTGTQDEWQLGLPNTAATTTANPVAAFTNCLSGVNCWKTDLTGTYNASSNQDLLSPNINLAGLSGPVIVTWAQRHQIETANFDHMFVDFQQVGGATPVRLYEWLDPTPISASAGTGNPQENIGGSYGWGVFSRRADSLAGLNTELRFHLDSDSSVQFGGLAIDDVSVSACRQLMADLSITKTDGVATAVPGQSVTYTITASNSGTDPVTGATVADTFPAILNASWTCVGAGGGTCTAGPISGNINDTVNLPVGGSVTYTVTAMISPSATGTLSNTATVSSTVTDPNPANNSATDTDTLTPSANLGITKTDGVTSVTAGNSVTYSITASNAGPSNAPGSTVADTFPASITGVTWTCTGAGGGTCPAGPVAGNINQVVNLPAGGSVTFTATGTLSASATGTLSNTATVATAGGVTDPVPGNNSATDVDTIISCTITCPSNITTNAATGQCSAVVTYPAPTTTGTCGTVTCTPASGSTFNVGTTTVTCSSSITGSCTFTVTVQDNQAPTITCPANQSVNGSGPTVVNYPAPTASDNCGSATVTCVPASGSSFAVGTTTVTCTASDASQVSPDATCTFTVTVTPCTITCPANQVAWTSGTTATVSYPAPTTTGSCGTVTCTPPSGSSFNVGTTTVTCSTTAGPSCSFTVTVNRLTLGASLADPLACSGPGNQVNGSFSATNTTGASASVTVSATLSNLVYLPNTATASVPGTVIVLANVISWTGTLGAGQTVTVSYLAQIADNATPGTQACSVTTATVNAIPVQGSASACITVNCPPVGPGGIFPASSEAGDQKAGSVLVYNIYTSGATSGNTQNTRINITNTHLTLPSYVHLFFVAESCAVADSYICLTGNQTASFLASDLDPGTTGYLVAIAVNAIGCPTSFNYLIGDEYVKFTTGHAANLGAIAFSQLAGGLPACDGTSSTAAINFDGISYNRTPATLALDNVGSRADGNDTLLILNRIGGNLGIGASSLGTLFGIFYDDAENALSFSVTGGCQLRNSITNNFPRITPRFETFVPAGRTGWAKIYNQTGAIGITGAAINFNPNASSSAGAFNQGHNLHHLTLNNSMSYIIPVFPPSC